MIRRKFFAACAAVAAGLLGVRARTNREHEQSFDGQYLIQWAGMPAHGGYFAISHRGKTFCVYASKVVNINGQPVRKLFARTEDGQYRGAIVPING